jgi:hypothetical protein
LNSNTNKRRPKIAIIDSGYDGSALWLDRRSKLELEQRDSQTHIVQNWKDFWRTSAQPVDEAGHGTSMLYTLMRNAPFADLCVARIAGNSDHMRRHPAIVSTNLAKVSHVPRTKRP